jgi:hypothetical protein
MIYKNKTWNILSIEEIISLLNKHQVNCILIGSEAGQIYNLCESTKDIDFMLDTSQENMLRLFNLLSEFFTLNFEEFLSLNRIVIRTLDKKPIEFIFDFPISESEHINFQKIKNNENEIDFYGNRVKIISEKDYIDYITKLTNYLQQTYNISNESHVDFTKMPKSKYEIKVHKYNNIINLYKNRNLGGYRNF